MDSPGPDDQVDPHVWRRQKEGAVNWMQNTIQARVVTFDARSSQVNSSL
jgi:hypothetical protein